MPVWHVARAPEGAVFIGRPSRWGNPFRVSQNRALTIERYRRHLWTEIESGRLPLQDLAELHERDLACYCAPQPCHGEVLERAAAWAQDQLGSRSGSHETRTPHHT